MTGAVTHQMMMLRPMQAGLSGYARLQAESRRQLVQVHLRGMQQKEMRVFWYAEERMVREVGRASTNARGEASLSAELPEDVSTPRRLVALLITDGGHHPRPLAIGLCTAQSAGSLMDARNALLALCERLGRDEAAEPNAGENETGSDHSPKPDVVSSSCCAAAPSAEKPAKQATPCTGPNASGETGDQAASGVLCASSKNSSGTIEPPKRTALPDLPREAFLPAIEARNYPERRRRKAPAGAQPPAAISGSEEVPERMQCRETKTRSGETACAPADNPPGSRRKTAAGRPPADLLPTLQWLRLFASLAAYFDQYPPTGLMSWPGWRFVHVPEGSHGLWIGYRQQDSCVQEVAYVLPMDSPVPAGQSFRRSRTASGQAVQLLVLKA